MLRGYNIRPADNHSLAYLVRSNLKKKKAKVLMLRIICSVLKRLCMHKKMADTVLRYKSVPEFPHITIEDAGLLLWLCLSNELNSY